MNKSKRLNNLIFKYKTKNLIYDLIFLTIVLIFAYICDKLYESIAFIVTFTLIRNDFNKSTHGSDFTSSSSKAIKYCRIITTSVQTISIIFIFSLDVSKYLNILLAILLGVISFFVKDYLELKIKKNIFYKGMKENELPNDLKGVDYDIVYLYYVKRIKLENIATKINYSIDNVKKKKAKIIKRYS